MLSHAWMGALTLGILWINALLVAAAALKDFGRLAALKRRLDESLVLGTVRRGDGPGGALAEHRVEQVGRATDDGRIVFSDRSYAGRVYGGAIAREGGGELSLSEAQPADVWVTPEAVAAAGACPSDEVHQKALETARKARGHERAVVVTVDTGAEVYVAEDGEGLLVATLDPRAWCRRKMAHLIAFVIAELALLCACTAVALVPPAFGLVSKLGAALCVAYFLLVQPAGTAMRDRVRPPSRAIVRGAWAARGKSGASSRLASSVG
jgi:hypothetical protein